MGYSLGKMSIFRLFERFVFIAWKGVFSFQNIVKDIFLVYIAQKGKLEKWSWGYKGLQGVTGGYKRLQGVTGGDKGLQGFQRIIETFL